MVPNVGATAGLDAGVVPNAGTTGVVVPDEAAAGLGAGVVPNEGTVVAVGVVPNEGTTFVVAVGVVPNEGAAAACDAGVVCLLYTSPSPRDS